MNLKKELLKMNREREKLDTVINLIGGDKRDGYTDKDQILASMQRKAAKAAKNEEAAGVGTITKQNTTVLLYKTIFN